MFKLNIFIFFDQDCLHIEIQGASDLALQEVSFSSLNAAGKSLEEVP